jgi:hypothetical protein
LYYLVGICAGRGGGCSGGLFYHQLSGHQGGHGQPGKEFKDGVKKRPLQPSSLNPHPYPSPLREKARRRTALYYAKNEMEKGCKVTEQFRILKLEYKIKI